MNCAELVIRAGDFVLCGEAATHVAVLDWSHVGCRMALCLEHAERPPKCVTLMDLRPPRVRPALRLV